MQSDTMRDNAEKCLLLAEKHSNHEPMRLRYIRMAAGWQDLADFQNWLDGQKRNAAAVWLANRGQHDCKSTSPQGQA